MNAKELMKKAPKYMVLVVENSESEDAFDDDGFQVCNWFFLANSYHKLMAAMKKHTSPGRVMIPCRVNLTPTNFKKKEPKV